MSYTEKQIQNIWNRATSVDGADKTMFRKDACGAWIRRDMYGVHDSDYGWEIDHIYPQSLGGTDVEDNLRALHHANNASKGDDYPDYEAVVDSDGMRNIRRSRYLVVNEVKREILRKYYPNA